MTIPINTTTIADGSTAAGDDINVTNCQDFAVHRFWITLGAGWAGAADVFIRGSSTGSGDWVNLSTAVNAVGHHVVEVERPFKFLQLHWTGNSGSKTLTCRVEQFHSKQVGNGF